MAAKDGEDWNRPQCDIPGVLAKVANAASLGLHNTHWMKVCNGGNGVLSVPKDNMQAGSYPISLMIYRVWVNTTPSGNKPAEY